MKRMVVLLVCACFCFSVFGCTKKKKEVLPKQNVGVIINDANYFPFKTGNSWTYSVTPPAGEEDNLVKIITVGEVASEAVDSVLYIVDEAAYKGADKTGLSQYMVSVNKDSIVKMLSAHDKEILLKLPLKAGDTWGDENISVLDVIPDLVKVPAGIVGNCVRVKTTYKVYKGKEQNPPLVIYDYYAPKSGLVKQTRQDPKDNSSEITVFELKNFTLIE